MNTKSNPPSERQPLERQMTGLCSQVWKKNNKKCVCIRCILLGSVSITCDSGPIYMSGNALTVYSHNMF